MKPEDALKKLTELNVPKEVIDVLTTLSTDATKATTDLENATKRIAEQDAVIAQKTNDIVQLRQSSQKEYKKLEEMTKEEKEALSEKEIELIKRAEDLEKQTAEFQASQVDAANKERLARIGRAFDKIVGTKDPELRKKAEDAYKKIVDNEKAQTEEEITKVAQDAYNMLGIPAGNPVRTAINEGGAGAPGGESGQNFAETAEGKGLAEAMNLSQAQAPK